MSDESDDEARGLALLKDGDLGDLDHPFDTLALQDPAECAAGLDCGDSDAPPMLLSRPTVPREGRFWHRRAKRLCSRDFFTMFRCRFEFTKRLDYRYVPATKC